MGAFSDEDLNICEKCIGDRTYATWIRENGNAGPCDIQPEHGDQNAVVSASRLAEYVDSWFSNHYAQGSHEPYFEEDSDHVSYQQRGEPYADLMMNELICDEGVISAIDPYLPDVDHRELTQGAERFYDSAQSYESFEEIQKRQQLEQEEYWYENRFRFQWEEFCSKVQYERRFFQLKELLDELFGSTEEYEKGSIRPLYELTAGVAVYRARLLDDRLSRQVLDSNPAVYLGAPPRERTRPGRMNVEYIPAFYAAFSEVTAVAEIRPGIGETIAVGKFVVQRTIKVFDFTVFARAAPENWREALQHTRYEFISQMEEEISKPVMPFDKQREYIPTQIIAEYLRDYFHCDAVIYRSAMIRDSKSESRNIVFLNKGGAIEEIWPLRFESRSIKSVVDITYSLDSMWF